MTCTRRFYALLVAVLGALAFMLTPASADDETTGPDNLVVVQTTGAGPTQAVDASTQLVVVNSSSVTNGNLALAVASDCTGCHSTAVAVQVLLVVGSPTTFAPENVAASANSSCTDCGTYAYAWQYAIQVPDRFHFTGWARHQIDDLRSEIADAAASIVPSDTATDPCFVTTGPPFPCETRDQQLDAKLNALTAQLKAVVNTGIRENGGGGDDGSVREQIQETPAS